MWTKRVLLVVIATLICASSAFSDALPLDTLRQAHAQLAPAICVLNFTQEITDPRSGEQRRQEGSAVALIVSPEGLLLTNGHLQREDVHSFNFRVRVRNNDAEEEYSAILLEKPADVNISLLRVQSAAPLNLSFARFKRGSSLALGEQVAIIGVMGEILEFERGLTVDRVMAILESPRTTYCLGGALRLGFVSGPVVNGRGEIVGVTGFDLASNEGGDLFSRSGHPLVYQTDLFIRYVDSPPDESSAPIQGDEAWLGVFTQPLKEEFAEYWGIDGPGGLIVSTVVPDSPAEEVGLQPGDVIRRFGDRPIRAVYDRDVAAFTKLVRESAPHTMVEIEYLRDGETQVVLATLGLRPRTARDAEEFIDEMLGLVVRELTRDIRILMNLGEDVRGVIVRRVVSGSPAHLARIQPGVIILAVNDYPVSNLDDFETAIEHVLADKPAEVSVFARVGAATGFFRLQPRW